jgi:hypothetical protein
VVVLLLQLAVLLVVHPVEMLVVLRPQRRRRRKRVRYCDCGNAWITLTNFTTEKEESDDDMGFGLFD